MRMAAERVGLAVNADSAGTGDWHVGQPPDPRAIATAARHGVDISGLRGRQVTRGDFGRFDEIVALDGRNLRDLRRLATDDGGAKLSLLLDHAPGRTGRDVADPYLGEDAGFEIIWHDIVAGVDGLLAEWAGQSSR